MPVWDMAFVWPSSKREEWGRSRCETEGTGWCIEARGFEIVNKGRKDREVCDQNEKSQTGSKVKGPTRTQARTHIEQLPQRRINSDRVLGVIQRNDSLTIGKWPTSPARLYSFFYLALSSLWQLPSHHFSALNDLSFLSAGHSHSLSGNVRVYWASLTWVWVCEKPGRRLVRWCLD